MSSSRLLAPVLALAAAACSQGAPKAAPGSAAASAATVAPPSPVPSAAAGARSPLAGASSCGNVSGAALGDGGTVVPCARFGTPEEALRAVLADTDPLVLAVGEAHAQKGTEAIASATKRFTTTLLPILAPRTSDIVVELWAPNPACKREVAQVASAQKPVTTAQAASNVNEYDALGTRAKALGTTPWLLRPTCEDFKAINEAGEGAVSVMLGLVKSLTAGQVRRLLARSAGAEAGAPRTVVAYGGMMHNDVAPAAAMKAYSFAEELSEATGGRYVELDLVVPEYVRPTAIWQALPWYATHEALGGADEARATLYQTGARSFVLVFAKDAAAR